MSRAFASGILVALVTHGAASAAPQKSSSGRYDFLGVIEQVDMGARKIVIRRGSKPRHERVTIRYDTNTEFVRARKPAAVADIRPDMRVWVYLREDGAGRTTDLARRLTLADPYPDIHGVVESVDARGNKLVVSRTYPGGSAKDRRQTLVVRVTAGTRITVEGRDAKLEDIPIGRRVAITSVRGSDNRTADAAAKISVWRETKAPARP
jgi:hypothetical protein